MCEAHEEASASVWPLLAQGLVTSDSSAAKENSRWVWVWMRVWVWFLVLVFFTKPEEWMRCFFESAYMTDPNRTPNDCEDRVREDT